MSASLDLIQAAAAMIVPTFTTMMSGNKPPVKPRRKRYFTFNCSDQAATSAATPAIEGRAHICISQDGSWFEGHLFTRDSSYALNGRRQRGWTPPATPPLKTANGHASTPIQLTNGHRDSISSTSSDDSPPSFTVAGNPVPDAVGPEDSVSGYYDVTVVDHDDEQAYPFSSVRLVNRSNSLWTLDSPHLSFSADHTHRGQKADMLIQKYLTPRLVGNNLKMSVGRLNMDLNAATITSGSNPDGPIPRRTSSDSRLWCL